MSKDLVEYASKYGDSDLQRLGLFIEMPYLRNEKDIGPKRKKTSEVKRYWTNAGSSYPKNGTQDGYFDSEFVRVFDGEYKSKPKERKDVIKDVFIPAGPGKKHSSPGDYWGCFIRDGEWPEHFSPIKKQKKKDPKEKVPPNPITNPGKKGGAGYIDITLAPYPEHMDEPPLKRKIKDKESITRPMYSGWRNPGYFDDYPFKSVGADGPTYVKPKEKKVEQKTIFIPTGPGKLRGGCFDGGFSHWPEHAHEPYNPKPKKRKSVIESRVFKTPGLVPKTLLTKSTLENTMFTVNAMNWKEYAPKYVHYL